MAVTAEKDIVARLLNFDPFLATGASLRQGEPPLDAQTPWVSYQVTEAEPAAPELSGSGTLVRYELAVGIAGADYAELRAVHDSVRTALDSFSGGQVQYCGWLSSDLSFVEEGKTERYGDLRFELVATEAAILPVASGVPLVEVHQDGLYFDGELVGATGPEGPVGPPGPEGPEGPEGPQGPAGASVSPPVTWTAPGASTVPLTLKGASSQTADLVQFQDSTTAVVAGVSSSGAGTFTDVYIAGHGGQGGTATVSFLPFGGNGSFVVTNQQIAFTNLGTLSIASGNTGWTPFFADSQTAKVTLRGVVFRYADEPIIEASDGSRWQIKVSTSGVLSTVAV